MSDLLAIASSGVRAYARALEAVADNVANAATPGHVRRSVALTPAGAPANPGPLELDPPGGNGVRVDAIVRAADLLQADNVRRSESDVAALLQVDRWLSSIQTVLTGAASLAEPIGNLFASIADLANDPDSIAVRATVLAQADTLAARFNGSAADLDRLATDLTAAARTEATSLNALSQGLADVNARLRRASPGSNAAALLADDRDRMLGRMASIATIDVRFDGRGLATVRVPDAGGPAIVNRLTATSIRVLPSGAGLELRVGPEGADEPATLAGGSLHGLATAAQLLARSSMQLDQLATRIGQDMNAIHRLGTDRQGNPAGDLFITTSVTATAAAANGGTARVTATLADGSPVPANGLDLVFNGTTGEWTLARPDLSDQVTGALPLTLDGVTVTAAGTPRNGDLFAVRPTGGAAALALRPLTPEQLAAAPRLIAEPRFENVGTAAITIRAAPPFIPPATPPFTITALPDGTLDLADATGLVLANGLPGDWLAGDGFEARIEGTPTEGDVFRILPTPPNSNANGTARALLALRDSGGPAGTIEEAQDRIVADIAVPLNAARARSDIARASRDTAAIALQQASGVDLNREAAEMLRLQQAYQANARIIQTARETFDAILSASA